MVIISRLVTKFNTYYADKPGMNTVANVDADYKLTSRTVLTIMVTNAVRLLPYTRSIRNPGQSYRDNAESWGYI